MLVCDTSAFINGRRDHFLPSIVPTIWTHIEVSIDDGRIIVPREVFRELTEKDDEIAEWIRRRSGAVVEPSETVQTRPGFFRASFPKPNLRNAADPFILAEAESRGFTVVTYEGRTFRGVPTTNWVRTMPGICKHFGIACCTLPEALEMLGISL